VTSAQFGLGIICVFLRLENNLLNDSQPVIHILVRRKWKQQPAIKLDLEKTDPAFSLPF